MYTGGIACWHTITLLHPLSSLANFSKLQFVVDLHCFEPVEETEESDVSSEILSENEVENESMTTN